MSRSIVFDPELAATPTSRCPYCRAVATGGAITLWDGRTYHPACIETVSPELLAFARAGGELVETLERSDLRLIHYVVQIGKSLFAIVLFVCLCIALFGQGPDKWVLATFVFVFFGVGGMIVCTLQGVCLLWQMRRRLPRTIRIAQGLVTVTSPDEEIEVPLEHCKWSFGRISADEVNLFSRLRRGVVIALPDRDISCGHHDDFANNWRSFLTLSKTWYSPPVGWLKLTLAVIVGMVVGCFLGACFGYVAAGWVGDDNWIPTLAFLGTVDGLFVVLLYVASTSQGFQKALESLHPALIWLVFIAVGVKIGIIGGVPAVFVVASGNAVVGGVAAAVCRAKVRAIESEREAAMELLR